MEAITFSDKLKQFNCISHAFFGKKSGESLNLFSSLNCSKYVGDDELKVSKNLEIVSGFIRSSKLITLHQIHSNICVEVMENSEGDIDADALVTRAKNVAIGVLTADCAPILFYDSKENIVGAAHAGWRGAAFGIIESTIRKMEDIGSNPKNIIVAIGPCIGKNSYEVDEEFMQNFHGKGDCFCLVNHKLHFDLPKFCYKKLVECGLQKDNIDVLNIDTFADNENYFSYRFATKNSNGVCGRQISTICLTGFE